MRLRALELRHQAAMPHHGAAETAYRTRASISKIVELRPELGRQPQEPAGDWLGSIYR